MRKTNRDNETARREPPASDPSAWATGVPRAADDKATAAAEHAAPPESGQTASPEATGAARAAAQPGSWRSSAAG